jgi:hypothetical protein
MSHPACRMIDQNITRCGYLNTAEEGSLLLV